MIAQTKSILLVEDDDDTCFMMSEMLTLFDVTFDIARDGQECIDMIGAKPNSYDLVLLDLHLPRKSGLQALEEIRNTRKHRARPLSVIAVTADENWHDPSKVIRQGFDDVVAKPVRVSDIQSILSV